MKTKLEKDIFGIVSEVIELSNNTTIGKYRKINGFKKGFYCKNCKYLLKKSLINFDDTLLKNFYKCRKMIITSGSGTDIRLSHIACNLYEERGE